MHHPGTTLAGSSRMNDRPRSPALPPISTLRTAPAPVPVEEELPRGDEAPEELDKYDISTLACTD